MKTNLNLFKNIILLIIIIISGTFFGLNMLNGISVNEFNEIYLKLWERGLNGIFLVLYLIIIFELSVSKSYSYIDNKFDKNIIIRVGYKKYYLQTIITIFLSAFIYSLIIHISIILLMNMFHTFDFTTIAKERFQHIYFSNNTYLNISIFVLLSSTGSSIFCTSIYPFLYFIKNKYLCKFIPVLTFFCTIILSFIISPIFQNFLLSITGNLEKAKTILCSIIPSSLIEPGCGWYSYALLDFVCGASIYILIMLFGFCLLKRYRGIHDD
ncbi:hypothetical protein [Candidatus Stoquefichus massiliensis]|uniref:hypothetical protein n=1 Tax=Candidatus Stoquefichus massiliensis TaxID=1470350 RepID=UPI0004B4BF02|nr:hypothetical protein [Candidatus Stoquefichus massiliensis]